MTRRLSRLGLVGLLVAVGIGVMAPVIGGLHHSSHGYASVRLEPGASVPLSAGSVVVLDSGDGQTRIGDCSIDGPGAWTRQILAAGSTTDIRTGPNGDYKITCQGGAVEVEDNAGAQSVTDPKANGGHRTTVAMFVVAGIIGLAGLGALIAAARADGRQSGDDGPSRLDADSDASERDPR